MMKISSDDRLSYLEIFFQKASSVDEVKIAGRRDVSLSVEASCNGFCGRNESIWFGEEQFQEFLEKLQVLERQRKGNVQLTSLGHPSKQTELNLQFYSTDSLGHVAIRFDLQKIKYSRGELNPFKLSAWFDLDSSNLSNIVAGFRALFNSKNIEID